MEKILIFYGSYGGGHKSAANAIKQYIENNYEDKQVEMIDCIEYISKIVNKLSTGAYNQMAKKAPWAWKKVYFNSEKGVLSKVSNGANALMSRKLNKLINNKKPNLIISTHPFSSQMCGRLKRKEKINCKIATIMTDYQIHNQWLQEAENMDWYFVSNEEMKTAMKKLGISENKIHVTGIPMSERFLESFNKQEILKEFELQENKKTILFFGGGEMGLGKERTCEILETLIDYFPNIQIVAISGRNAVMNEQFKKIVQQSQSEDRVKIHAYTNKVPELMSISDMVITKPGGLTTTESIASELPIIVINPLPGQEEQNAEFLEKNQLGMWLKKGDNIKEKLESIINDEEVLKQMKNNAKALAKKTSTRDICKTIIAGDH